MPADDARALEEIERTLRILAARARSRGFDLLCYLIEMARLEADDERRRRIREGLEGPSNGP